MDVRDYILGTLTNIFQLGKGLAISFVNNSGILEIKNKAQDGWAVLRAKSLNDTSSPNDNDVATFLDLCQNKPLIEFVINGAGTPPEPGDNTNKFGYCYATGGDFTEKRVYFDNGTELKWVRHLFDFKTSYTGSLSPLSNSYSYGWDNGQWRPNGDGAGGNTGAVKVLKIPFTKDSTTVSSTVSFTEGTKIHGWNVNKSAGFNGTNPTLSAKVDGTTDLNIITADENDLSDTVQDGSKKNYTVASGNVGLVVVTISAGSSTTGAGEVIIYYSTTQAE